MCCGQSASADCFNAKQRWLRQFKTVSELRTPQIIKKIDIKTHSFIISIL